MAGPGCWRSLVIFRANSLLTVHLRFSRLPTAHDAVPTPHLLRMLSPSERARCARLPGVHARRALLARALVRTELASALNVAPASLVFVIGDHGKPEIFDPPQAIAFNLSHSGDWALLAWLKGSAKARVGVDIEHRAAGERDVLRLARRYFSAAEQRALEKLEGLAQEALFYRLWTLKEAWVKAHGLALAPQLGAVSFSLDAGLLRMTNRTDHASGRLMHGEVDTGVWASLCVLGDGVPGDGVPGERVLGSGVQPHAVEAQIGAPLGEWSPMSMRDWSDSIQGPHPV